MSIASGGIVANSSTMIRAHQAVGDSNSPAIRNASANSATRALRIAAATWFVVTVLGQLMFVIYIAGFYGVATARGDLAAWGKVMPHGYVPGDTVGNVVMGVHLLFAALITLSGAVQLLPVVRRLAPKLHHWNGRFYLTSAVLMSVGGLYLVWTRGSAGNLSQHLATSLNALLILAFAAMALRHALARRFVEHRRWALRLFLVVSGVWFFRIGLMFWLVVNQGPVGFDPETFRGPFLTILAFSQTLVPLALLQLYFNAQEHGGSVARFAMTGALAIGTLVTAVGSAGATMMMWLPNIG